MRFDKFTTKFQQAVSDAQSLAVGNDQQFIEPQHLLLALLNQEDGSTASLLARAGANVGGLKAALAKALERLPKVEGHGGDVSIGRDLTNLLNVTDKEAQKAGDQFIASEMFLLALTQDKGECGRLLKEAGLNRKALEDAVKAVRGGENVGSQDQVWAAYGGMNRIDFLRDGSFDVTPLIAPPDRRRQFYGHLFMQLGCSE
jgi:ATP-dependent Clp protease ATP-binding subunit ClpB